MKSITRVLIMLAITLSCGVFSSSAQIYVNVRPERPHYERPAPPSPSHVWIDEEWEPRGNSYVFVGGHWAAPPAPGRTWSGGHWNHGRHGHSWTPGHWSGESHGHHR